MSPTLPTRRVVGACSICGGLVSVPTIWFGTVPPIPTCSSCGATAAPPAPSPLPVIPMQPPTHTWTDTQTDGSEALSREERRPAGTPNFPRPHTPRSIKQGRRR